MHNKKYGIWKTRYAYNSRKTYEGWLLKNGQPLTFTSKQHATVYKQCVEMKANDNSIELEVRCFS